MVGFPRPCHGGWSNGRIVYSFSAFLWVSGAPKGRFYFYAWCLVNDAGILAYFVTDDNGQRYTPGRVSPPKREPGWMAPSATARESAAKHCSMSSGGSCGMSSAFHTRAAAQLTAPQSGGALY